MPISSPLRHDGPLFKFAAIVESLATYGRYDRFGIRTLPPAPEADVDHIWSVQHFYELFILQNFLSFFFNVQDSFCLIQSYFSISFK